MDVIEKIKALMSARELNPTALARRMNVPPVTVTQRFNRGSIPAKALPAYARALGVSVAELVSDAPVPTSSAAPIEPAERSSLTIAGLDYVALPVYAISAAAGDGQLVNERDDGDVISYSVFRSSWLRGVTSAPTNRLAVLRIAGDSMWPTLHHGDSVLVDLTVTAIGRDGVYVIRVGDEVQCKRCSRHPTTGALTIASDNPAYPTYSDIKPAGLAVLGRVIWTGRTM
jgi:phage repressor protein C with HTH and peptisase S24 domain